jgi:hypothetical protein
MLGRNSDVAIGRAACLTCSPQLLLAPRYIASGRTTQKTHPLPSNGCPLLLRIRCRGVCLLRHCLPVCLCWLFSVVKANAEMPLTEHTY